MPWSPGGRLEGSLVTNDVPFAVVPPVTEERRPEDFAWVVPRVLPDCVAPYLLARKRTALGVFGEAPHEVGHVVSLLAVRVAGSEYIGDVVGRAVCPVAGVGAAVDQVEEHRGDVAFDLGFVVGAVRVVPILPVVMGGASPDASGVVGETFRERNRV